MIIYIFFGKTLTLKNTYFMPISKLFPSIDIDNFPELRELESSPQLWDTDICHYAFSVIWTKGTDCKLNFLGGNRPSSSEKWHPIIKNAILDDDGEISVSLGNFPNGTAINLSFGIQAIDEIPRLILLITNLTTKTVLKIPSGDDFKALARGGFWQTPIEIKHLP
jgi:hypothetical protein